MRHSLAAACMRLRDRRILGSVLFRERVRGQSSRHKRPRRQGSTPCVCRRHDLWQGTLLPQRRLRVTLELRRFSSILPFRRAVEVCVHDFKKKTTSPKECGKKKQQLRCSMRPATGVGDVIRSGRDGSVPPQRMRETKSRWGVSIARGKQISRKRRLRVRNAVLKLAHSHKPSALHLRGRAKDSQLHLPTP